MVPVHTHGAADSPFSAVPEGDSDHAVLYMGDDLVGTISFPPAPNFYGLSTSDGVPYWKIAQLHARDVIATTVLQTCIRYGDPETRCQFCAISESLKADRTISRKSPSQLAEVAAAAKELDGVKHMVMTTGTPGTPDRGAEILSECAEAIKERSGLPLQAQCEPPDDFVWFGRMKNAGIDTLGMHLEAFSPDVRAKMMPSKAEISVEYYHEAYRSAVRVFGWGQVSTYIIAGLGDTRATLLSGCRELIDMGVYPFVVPFVPIAGSRLEASDPPTPDFMHSVLRPLGEMLSDAGMTSDKMKAGCGKCGACSPLSTFES